MDQFAGLVTPDSLLPVQPVAIQRPGISKKTLLILGIVALLVIWCRGIRGSCPGA
ncbi:MAG: hypothetical protein NTZ37_07165 [Methanoregula sp.]|nr:hypothetical protein [Methanoregula sp.]